MPVAENEKVRLSVQLGVDNPETGVRECALEVYSPEWTSVLQVANYLARVKTISIAQVYEEAAASGIEIAASYDWSEEEVLNASTIKAAGCTVEWFTDAHGTFESLDVEFNK